MTTQAIRERAARFYFKASGITGGIADWIESGVVAPDYPIDEDVLALAVLLEAAVAAERERVAKMADDAAEQKVSALEAGLRDAIEAIGDMTGFVEAKFYAEKYGIAETVARLRKLLPESFHPNAQAPEITGESAPGIVSPVATEDSGATK